MTTTPLAEIARRLSIDVIVEGCRAGVRGPRPHPGSSSSRRRLDALLWAKSFERDQKDVLALRNEVAHSMVNEIDLETVTPRSRTRLRRARQMKCRGVSSCSSLGGSAGTSATKRMSERAIAYFTQALTRDPDYAAALVGVADSYLLLGTLGLLPGRMGRDRQSVGRTRAAARCAACRRT